VQGYIGYDVGNASIVLAFRGSSNVQNWIVDFAFPMVQFDGLPAGAEVSLPPVPASSSAVHALVRFTGGFIKRSPA
jgi:hypothetical protein